MKPVQNGYDEANQAFVERVVNLCADRGVSAALRRWWSPATQYQALPILGQLAAIDHWPKSTVAALYATHSAHQTDGPGIGRASLLLGERKEGEHPYDRHFRRLIAADSREDIATQLHRLVRRLSREGVALDYVKLLKQLNFWNTGYQQDVRVRWAKEFWQAPLTNYIP